MSGTNSPQGGLTRRSFLKTTAAVAGASALAGGAGLTALASEEKDKAEELVFYNTCRGNCGSKCALKSVVREGKIVKTSPVPMPEGREYFRYGCTKTNAGPQRIYAPNRVLYPLRRVEGTDRGAGEWERISWDDAISVIAEKFQAAIDEHDGRAIAFWHSYGSTGYLNGTATTFFNYPERVGATYGVGFERFTQKIGATILTASADFGEMYMQYYALQFPNNSFSDVARAKTIIVWGMNPTDAVRDLWPFIHEAKDNGATLVTIDPQYTTSAAHSDTWVPIRPGTDGALMLAMANHIIEKDLIDYDYMKNGSVGPLLIKEDGTYLRLSDLGMDPVDGVDTEVVFDEASQAFGSSRAIKDPALSGSFDAAGMKVRTVYDYVVESIKDFTVEFAAEECDLPVELITNLAELYATNKPSTICSYQGIGHHFNSRHNYKDQILIASLTGNINKPGASIYQYNSGSRLGLVTDMSDLIIDDPLPVSAITGMHLPDIMDTGKWVGEDYPIKCLYIMNGNPLASDSGRVRLIEAVKKVDFVVTADSFMTDSAKYSDIVLPINLSWEAEDFMTHIAVNVMMQKAVEPCGEARSDIDAFRELANRMGYTDLFSKTNEEYLRTFLDTPENVAAGLTYDNYKKHGYFDDFNKYEVEVGQEYNATGRSQFYVPVMPVRDNWGQVLEEKERIPWYETPLEATPHHPDNDKYPLFAVSDHHNLTGHSLYLDVPWIDELRPEPYMKINDKAASDRGIEQGDYVRVYNERGSAVLRAVVTKGIREDTVYMPHSWQSYHYTEGHHQDLTCGEIDPVTGNSAFNDYHCQVEKYERGDAK